MNHALELLKKSGTEDFPHLEALHLILAGDYASKYVKVAFAHNCVCKTIERHAIGSSINYWAKLWLSGKDRTPTFSEAAEISIQNKQEEPAAWSANAARLFVEKDYYSAVYACCCANVHSLGQINFKQYEIESENEYGRRVEELLELIEGNAEWAK